MDVTNVVGKWVAPWPEAALRCDRDEWLGVLDDLGDFSRQFGGRLPVPIRRAHAETARPFRG